MAKQNTLTTVPRLRFPEFRSAKDWTTIELRQLSEFVTERVGATDCTPYTVSAGVGLVSQQEKLGRTIAGNSLKNYIVLQKNDFAYNKSATKAFPQGFIAKYVGEDRAAVPNSIFTCFRTNDDLIDPTYLDNLFSTNLHGNWLRNRIAVGARAHGSLNVSDEDLMDLPVPLPAGSSSLVEQQKIADCLTSLDEVIAAQGRIVTALKAHKRGLMQQLFPREGETRPRLRFPEFRNAPEWEQKAGGVLFENRKVGGEEGLPIYSVTVNDGMVQRASFERDFYDIEDPAKNKKACKGDIAYNMMRMWQGAQGVAVEDCMVSPAYVVLSPLKGVCSGFFAYLFKLPQSLELLTAYSRGLTKDRLRLYFDDFARMQLCAPGHEEQQRIADCLSALDTRIAAESRQLTALKTHKQGLMQQLFPTPEATGA